MYVGHVQYVYTYTPVCTLYSVHMVLYVHCIWVGTYVRMYVSTVYRYRMYLICRYIDRELHVYV